jgi:hypothetical protein
VLRTPAAAAPPPPALAAEEVARLLGELEKYRTWLAQAVQFDRAAIPSALRSIETRRQEHLQSVRDLLTLITAEPDSQAQARGFVQRQAALREQRDHADRLAAFLLANTRGSASVT